MSIQHIQPDGTSKTYNSPDDILDLLTSDQYLNWASVECAKEVDRDDYDSFEDYFDAMHSLFNRSYRYNSNNDRANHYNARLYLEAEIGGRVYSFS